MFSDPMVRDVRTALAHGVQVMLSKECYDVACCAGKRRVLRLLQALKVTSVPAHYDLLLSIARVRPDLASIYLASCQLSLDPQPGLKWLAGMSLLGSMIQLCPVPEFEKIPQR